MSAIDSINYSKCFYENTIKELMRRVKYRNTKTLHFIWNRYNILNKFMYMEDYPIWKLIRSAVC